MLRRMDETAAYRVESAEGRKALASPVRLEILGHFVEPEGMSVADLAERMGRNAGSLYYHVHLLEEAGLLRRAGRRVRNTREETLYRPVAERFEMAAAQGGAGGEEAVTAMAAAFRMAERELEAAVGAGEGVVGEGPGRNTFALRLHCRLTPEALAEVNHHLDALMETLTRETGRRTIPEDAVHYCSLTLALLPLRGRGQPA